MRKIGRAKRSIRRRLMIGTLVLAFISPIAMPCESMIASQGTDTVMEAQAKKAYLSKKEAIKRLKRHIMKKEGLKKWPEYYGIKCTGTRKNYYYFVHMGHTETKEGTTSDELGTYRVNRKTGRIKEVILR